MTVVLIILGVFVWTMGAVALVVYAGYRARDVVGLTVLGTVTLFLGRWNDLGITMIADRPIGGLLWYMLLVVIAFLPFSMVVREQPALQLAPLALWVGIFSTLALLSGVFNRGALGLAAAVQVLATTLLPLAVALVIVNAAPRTHTYSRRLRFWLILLGGIVTPPLVLVSAIMPNQIGSLLGWSTFALSRSTGFVRGWSPIGSPIATGSIMVLAYAFAMHEVIGCRRRWYFAVLLLVATAVLFTLARSVLLMFFLFHVIYFWGTVGRYFGRILGITCVTALVMVPVIIKLQERYSFERFAVTSDSSLDIRGSSAWAALRVSARQPILGEGPGLVYDAVRTDRLLGRRVSLQTVVAGEYSALEPHNVYLLVAAEHGWPAVFVVCALAVFFWRRFRIGPETGDDEDRSAASAFRAGWLAFGAMLMTHSGPLLHPQASALLWFFACTGLHWRATLHNESGRSPPCAG